MPTYEYRCTRCGQITEEFKPVSAPRRQRCPACRGKVERLLSGGTGVLFKGPGFYVTDSRGKKAKASAPESPAAAADAPHDNQKGAQDKRAGAGKPGGGDAGSGGAGNGD